MTRLTWDQDSARTYEQGLSNGVLYRSGIAVPWNGLISVAESQARGEVTPFYYDGVKYLDVASSTDYQAVLTAFSAPVEFSPCNGDIPVIPGMILTRQAKQSFGLAYRTRVNATDSKIHLIYNAVARMTARGYRTRTSAVEPINFQWTIDAVPISIPGFRPSAHYIVDSRKTLPSVFADLESQVFGSATRTPALPSPTFLYRIFNNLISEPISEPI